MKSKSLIACLSGNVIEWYEFSLFMFLASQISPHFFNTSEAITSKIFVLLTFAIGFLSRPLGGVIFGVIGDVLGRKKALFLSIFLMTSANGLIGILPGYNDIGWTSPALLVACRLVQGISNGGEFTTSMVYLTENHVKQTIVGSLSYSSAHLGLLLGALVGFTQIYLVNVAFLPKESWRFLFLLCLPLGAISYYLRKYLLETIQRDSSLTMVHSAKRIFSLLFSAYKKEMMVVFFINALAMSAFYNFSLYVISWDEVNSGKQYLSCIFNNSFLLLLTIISLPLFALISERFELKHYLSFIGLALVVCLYPLMMPSDDTVRFVTASVYALLIAAFLAPLPKFFCTIFPKNVRNTGVAISFNLAAVLFGPTSAAVFNAIAKKDFFIQSVYIYFSLLFLMTIFGIFYANKNLKLKGDAL